MNFDYSQKVKTLSNHLVSFMDKNIYPNEATFFSEINSNKDRWQVPSIIEDLKILAKKERLWNLFLPESEHGAQLSNLEYAPLAEIMGRSLIA